MFGSVDLGGRRIIKKNYAASYRMRALGAELCCRRKLGAAVRAGARQRSSALLAELCLRLILMLALRTLHAETSSAGREKLKVEPWPGALDTVICPPCNSTSKRV